MVVTATPTPTPPHAPTPAHAEGAQRGGPIARAADLAGKDVLTLTALSARAVLDLFETAAAMKRSVGPFRLALDCKCVLLIFEKASLRTRLTFEAGVAKLGGQAVYMDHSVQRLGDREAVKDYGRNLERWMDGIVARVYSQKILEELAANCDVPVINALSDRFHPCQALADLFTLWERTDGTLRHEGEPIRVAFVGDGNNVCHSLLQACAMLGVDVTVVGPKGNQPDATIVEECEALGAGSGAKVTVTSDLAAVKGHHAVYTDVWVSMGQADSAGKRRKVFNPYQVNAELMAKASAGLAAAWGPALFMHCLPAQRGVEVTDEVIDAPTSVVYDQAENRMHVQNALMYHVLGNG